MSVKFTCGPIHPSGCVLYTGDTPEFIDDPSCNMMLDELLEKYGAQVQEILTSIDLTELDKKSLVFNPETIDIKGLHQVEIDALDDHATRLAALETSLGNINTGNKLLEINLGCLTPTAAPCAASGNTYSILSLFTLLFNEICQIKSQLA